MEESKDIKPINLESQQAMKNSWNAFAKIYDQFMHLYMLQTFTTLAVHAGVPTKKRVLEVACGSGYHSLCLAKTMLQKGAALVCTDISDEMIKQLNDKFEDPENDYFAIAGNKTHIKPEELLPLGQKTFDLEAFMTDKGIGPKDRFVLGCLGNNESLPFKDGTFDCYISNLSMMIVDDHLNMLAEALRVCQPGSTYAFSVWGRKENIQLFEIFNTVLEKYDLLPKVPPKKTNYDLGKDPQKLRDEMLGMGFKNIRMWYQPMNYKFESAESYAYILTETVSGKKAISSLTPEQKEQFMQDLKEEYNRKQGPETLDPNTFEVLVITAIKP